MKIGIVTLYDKENYGNRLQNYAVEKICKKYGAEPETLVPYASRVPYALRGMKKIYHRIKLSKAVNAKIKNFEKFNERYMNLRKLSPNAFELLQNTAYDYIFLGGDQIWGEYRPMPRHIGYAFGTFVPPERRITMSPSFGGDKIPAALEPEYAKYLSQLKHISVREKSGAALIKRLTGREAQVVIDPVMALTREEWLEIFDGGKFADDRYVLACFLSGTDEKTEARLAEAADGREIKRLYDKRDKLFTSGPEDFLSLIYSADAVCTDSFHCAAFAILFKRPVVIFNRLNFEPSQMTRLYNLLEMFGMENRRADRLAAAEYYECDYSRADGILEEKRREFYGFLDRFFEGEADD